MPVPNWLAPKVTPDYANTADGLRDRAQRAEAEVERLREGLTEQFIVCFAAGYPDPFSPHPNTYEEAVRFADEHTVKATTGERVHPVVRRRVASSWEEVYRA